MARIVQLLRSPVHRYAGRPPHLPDDNPAARTERARATAADLVSEFEVRAGLGIVGDRYFNRPAHRDASVTLLNAAAIADYGVDLAPLRRNIALLGVDVDGSRGRVLSLDCGSGEVQLALRRAAHPCRWLDVTVADGAWRALRGRAGMRCEPLTDGVLRVGPVDARWLQ